MNENQSIEVVCRDCGATHHVNLRLAGRRVRCPHCDAHVDVPTAISDPEVAASSSPASLQSHIESGATPLMMASMTEFPGVVLTESAHDSIDAIELPDTAVLLHDEQEEDEDEPIPQRPEWHDEELDMTSMVDVTFLLLIFFMVTASFSLQKSIESARQQSEAASSTSTPEVTEELDMVTVQINEQGSFLVLAPDWERETPGKQNLIRALKEALGDGSTPMKLVIEVHEAAKLQALVDCMDAGTLSDYGEVQVTQVEGFE